MSDTARNEYRYGDQLPDLQQPASGEVPINPYSLLQAVNDASEIAHTAWLIFLGVVAYLGVAVAGITHRDLLLGTPVPLPILQVDIGLTRFFLFAPIILVFLHFGLLVQHAMLARKTLEFHAALRQLEPTDLRTHPLRLELHSYYFSQALAGPTRSPFLAMFLHGMTWLSIVVLPVLVIVYIQVMFLPYHDEWITWAHRVAVVADVIVLLLIGVFLTRRDTEFYRAFFRVARHQPVNFVFTATLLTAMLLFSFFVATVPDEALDRFAGRLTSFRVEKTVAASGDLEKRLVFGLTAALFESGPGGLLQRNLIVSDVDLVSNKEDQDGNSEVSISLRDRDLRYAVLDRSDLHRADLTGAKLMRASLHGTDLREARISCPDVGLVIVNAIERDDVCARLTDVNLQDANLEGADLRFARLTGANLAGAKLQGADMGDVDLVGADLSGANLNRARLLRGSLIETNLLGASLQGADLAGAKLHGADFTSANLEGAQLTFVLAIATKFDSARLDGANLTGAKLFGTDLANASLKGADFGTAVVWSSTPTVSSEIELADFSRLKLREPSDGEIEAFTKLAAGVTAKSVRARIGAKVARLSDQDANRNWEGSAELRTWQDQQRSAATSDATSYRSQLSRFLVKLSCRAKFADGAVAFGIARRAATKDFKGEVADLFTGLTGSGCPASGQLSDELKMRLRVGAESSALAASAVPEPVAVDPAETPQP